MYREGRKEKNGREKVQPGEERKRERERAFGRMGEERRECARVKRLAGPGREDDAVLATASSSSAYQRPKD